MKRQPTSRSSDSLLHRDSGVVPHQRLAFVALPIPGRWPAADYPASPPPGGLHADSQVTRQRKLDMSSRKE